MRNMSCLHFAHFCEEWHILGKNPASYYCEIIPHGGFITASWKEVTEIDFTCVSTSVLKPDISTRSRTAYA